jgi:hypothetical protein
MEQEKRSIRLLNANYATSVVQTAVTDIAVPEAAKLVVCYLDLLVNGTAPDTGEVDVIIYDSPDGTNYYEAVRFDHLVGAYSVHVTDRKTFEGCGKFLKVQATTSEVTTSVDVVVDVQVTG